MGRALGGVRADKSGNSSFWERIKALDQELASVNLNLENRGLAAGPFIPKPAPIENTEPSVLESNRTAKVGSQDFSSRVVSDSPHVNGRDAALFWSTVRQEVSGSNHRYIRMHVVTSSLTAVKLL